MQPRVSVIVPVYNAEKYLETCVNSILNQSFSETEIILVDDGSSDESGKMCDNFSNENRKIKVIHTKNGGVSKARNTGIRAALGEYIVFIDSDDYVENNYVEELIRAADKFKEAAIICCGFKTVGKARDFVNVFSESEEYSVVSKQNVMELNKRWLDAMPWNKLYKKSVIMRNNIFMEPGLSLGEDIIFNYRYFESVNEDEIIVVNKPLYNYVFQNLQSLDSKYRSNLFEIYTHIEDEIYKVISKWKLPESEMRKFYNFCFFKYELVFKNTFNQKNKLKFHSKIAYNNKIIKSSEFKYCVKNMSHKLNILHRASYSLNNYLFVMLSDKLLAFLSKIKRMIKRQ